MLGSKLVVINLNQQVRPLHRQRFQITSRMFSLSSNSTHFSFNSSPHPYPQTDSSDLLGNWKPVDVRVLIRPAVAEFETLFESTLSSRANAELLTQLRLRLDKGKHSECIKIMSKGTHTCFSKKTFVSCFFFRIQGCTRPYFEKNVIGFSRRRLCQGELPPAFSAVAVGNLADQDIQPRAAAFESQKELLFFICRGAVHHSASRGRLGSAR